LKLRYSRGMLQGRSTPDLSELAISVLTEHTTSIYVTINLV